MDNKTSKDKLLLVDIRENSRRKGTQVNIYDEAYELLKDLNARTGQSLSLLANRLIKFAYNYIEIDSEKEED